MGKHYVKLTELAELLTAQAVNGYIERGDVVKCLYSAPSICAAKLNSIAQQERPRIYKTQDFTGNVINYRHNGQIKLKYTKVREFIEDGKIGKFISPLRLKLTEMGIDISQVKRGEKAFDSFVDGGRFDEFEFIFTKAELAKALGVSANTVTKYFKMGLRPRVYDELYSKYWVGWKGIRRYCLLGEIIEAIKRLNAQ